MKNKAFFIVLSILLLLLLGIDVMFGATPISLNDFLLFFQENKLPLAKEIIIAEYRIPKALTAILCGASLSLAGLLMQTLFRNPLAGPYILGISSGAGLGVALLIMGAGLLGISTFSTLSISVAALTGAFIVLSLLFIVSFKVKDVMTLLIFGVLLGSVATAVISLIQFYTSDYQLKSFVLWTMGSLAAVQTEEIIIIALALLIASIVILGIAKNLNTLLVSESFAKSLGVNTVHLKITVLLIGGLLAGLCTAYCGPIGFVGIIIPHICRMLFKTNNHIILLPACLLMGADVLLLSDIISNLPRNGVQLPINSITALIGIPVIFWIIFSKKSISKSI